MLRSQRKWQQRKEVTLLIPEGGSVFGHQVDQFSMINFKGNGQSGSIFGHQVDQFSIDKNKRVMTCLRSIWERWMRVPPILGRLLLTLRGHRIIFTLSSIILLSQFAVLLPTDIPPLLTDVPSVLGILSLRIQRHIRRTSH